MLLQFLKNLGAKLKFWAPIISSVGNVQLPAPSTFTHDADFKQHNRLVGQ